MKAKSDGEIYEQISREAMEKLDPTLHEQIVRMLIEMVNKDMDKTERPKKPYLSIYLGTISLAVRYSGVLW